ncbi:MAG TPA: hypothetical protein VIT45_03645 [Allosphingosinicella sp.]
MPKPPKSTPHSDLDGVRKDQGRKAENARDAGEDSADLERAHRESAGRPPYSGEEKDRGG